MKEPARLQRNQDRLKECHPKYRARLARVIKALEADGERPRIQDGWRSIEDQLKAYEAGHSKLKFGFHNVTAADGNPEALAVDLLDDDAPLAPGIPYLLKLAAAAEKAGLVSGIRWGLPKRLRMGIDAAIAAQDWRAQVRVGWDPTHVETIDVTVAQARQGRRPTS